MDREMQQVMPTGGTLRQIGIRERRRRREEEGR